MSYDQNLVQDAMATVKGKNFVIKRDGRKEPVHFDKITTRIGSLCYGLSVDHVDASTVAQKVIGGIYPGVTTVELDELAAREAASLVVTHPDYGKLAARIAVSNLHKQTKKCFSAVMRSLYGFVHPRTLKASPLISDEVMAVIEKNEAAINGALVYNRDYQLTYFGFQTLMRSYLLRMPVDIDGPLRVVECPQHMYMRVALGIHGTDVDSAIETYHLISKHYFTHASPTMFNAGTPHPQMASCFLLDMQEDSIEGIYDTLKFCAVISKSAGGVGLNVHKIRARGSYIAGTNGESNGLVPMLRVYNNCFPEDHQVLTAAGFMDYQAVMAHFATESTLAIACYVDGALEYHSISADQVTVAEGTHRHVEMTDAATGVSLVPTTNHRMWLRVGETVPADDDEAWKAAPQFTNVAAGDVLKVVQETPSTAIQFTASFDKGLVASADTVLPFASRLGLTTEEQVLVYLEVYGYWLCNAWLDGANHVDIGPHNEAYLLALFARLEQPVRVALTLATMFPTTALPYWVWLLKREHVRAVLRGLQLARRTPSDVNGGVITTPTLSCRNDVERLAIHAGYSTLITTDGVAVVYTDEACIRMKGVALKDYDVDGRVWCVTVPTKEHLIMVRRPLGTGSSRPVIVGNTARYVDQGGNKRPGAFACFAADTEVMTINAGVKRIQDVQIGDLVVTHLDRVRPVVQVHQNPLGDRKLYKLKVEKTKEVFVTGNHKFWSSWTETGKDKMVAEGWHSVEELKALMDTPATTRQACYISIPSSTGIPETSAYKQLDLRDFSTTILKGIDTLEDAPGGKLVPLTFDTDQRGQAVNRYWAVNEDLVTLFGMWLRDGRKTKHGITFAVHKDNLPEMEFITRTCQTAFGCTVTLDTPHLDRRYVTVDSHIVGAVFTALFGSDDKRLPNMVFGWPLSLVNHFMAGLTDAPSDLFLMNQLYHLCRNNGLEVTDEWQTSYSIPPSRELLAKVYHDDRVEARPAVKDQDKFLKVLAIEEVDRADEWVYTLGVQEDHSYTVEGGLICENCYLEPWHADIFDFISMKRKVEGAKGSGVDETKGLDLFYALWVPDLFWRRVEAGEDWTLMCPHECPGLDECWGAEFEALYTKYEREGKGCRTIKAAELVQHIVETEINEGMPFILNKDACNRASNQQNLGTIKSSNLCVHADTLILTEQGHLRIGDFVDKAQKKTPTTTTTDTAGEVLQVTPLVTTDSDDEEAAAQPDPTETTVWNGHEWSKVRVCQTGTNQVLMTVSTSFGTVLKCTPEHKFILENGTRVEARALTLGAKLARERATLVPADRGRATACVTYPGVPEATMNAPFLTGFIYGYVVRTQGTKDSFLGPTVPSVRVPWLVIDKTNTVALAKIGYDPLAPVPAGAINTEALAYFPVPEQHQTKRTAMANTAADRTEWVAGFLSALGQLDAGSGSYNLLYRPWLMLRSTGRDCALVKIHGDPLRPLWKLKWVQPDEYPTVTGLTCDGERGDTYCFTEPLRHAGVFGGQLTGQCTEIIEYTSPSEIAVCLTGDTLIATDVGPQRLDACHGQNIRVPFVSDVDFTPCPDRYQPAVLIDNGVCAVKIIETTTATIRATDAHRFLTVSPQSTYEWRTAGELQVNDCIVRDMDGTPACIQSITEGGRHQVYDLALASGHHFVANGLVVHNCNLASIALAKFVTVEKTYDFASLHAVTKVVTANLNKTIDRNFYHLPEMANSNLRHRPIGIGVQALADTFCLMGMPFDSPQARLLNKQIFETIYHGFLEKSCELAAVHGPYATYEGSPMSKGLLQFDMWTLPDNPKITKGLLGPTPTDLWDWTTLRAAIKQHGVYNSQGVALMPTASTSQIMNNNECFEPFTSNIFARKVLSGFFQVVNQHLMNDLIKLNLWDENMRDLIIAHRGSVQHIPTIPDDLKAIYRTAWEIPQKHILEMAADRGPYVDQSQSMNVRLESPTNAQVASMHLYGWKLGLKTGQYYLRIRPATDPIQFTVSADVKAAAEAQSKLMCSIRNKDDCVVCSS